MIINILNMINKISKYNYTHTIKTIFKNLDNTAKKILKYGIQICTTLSIISVIILIYYLLNSTYTILYNIGITIFKFSIIFTVEFVICAFISDKVKQELK